MSVITSLTNPSLAPGDTFEGIFTAIRYTSGSPFGEQWSYVQRDDSTEVKIATWIDHNDPECPRRGDRVTVTASAPRRSKGSANSTCRYKSAVGGFCPSSVTPPTRQHGNTTTT